NLAIGQHLVDAVDLLQPGRLPAVAYRRYNPFDAFGRIAGFELFLGQGWALSLDIAQLDVHPSLRRLVMPGNARYEFARQSDGRTVSFTTSLLVPGDETSARLTQVRDALGRTVQYAYDPASRRLQSVTDAAGGETRYAYDVDGRLLSIRDQKGVTYVKNQYD